MNYKAKLLRQEIAGLEREQARRIKMVADVDEALERQRVRLRSTRRSLRDARAELDRIEGLTASVEDLTGRKAAG